METFQSPCHNSLEPITSIITIIREIVLIYMLFTFFIPLLYTLLIHCIRNSSKRSIVLNIFSINIMLTAAKFTSIIILHLFIVSYMSFYSMYIIQTLTL